jgi:hypothetical protein
MRLEMQTNVDEIGDRKRPHHSIRHGNYAQWRIFQIFNFGFEYTHLAFYEAKADLTDEKRKNLYSAVCLRKG